MKRECSTFLARILDRAVSAEFVNSLQTLAGAWRCWGR